MLSTMVSSPTPNLTAPAPIKICGKNTQPYAFLLSQLHIFVFLFFLRISPLEVQVQPWWKTVCNIYLLDLASYIFLLEKDSRSGSYH